MDDSGTPYHGGNRGTSAFAFDLQRNAALLSLAGSHTSQLLLFHGLTYGIDYLQKKGVRVLTLESSLVQTRFPRSMFLV